MDFTVMAAEWPGLPLVADELDQVPRRTAFKDAHPGATFERLGDVFIGHVPYTDNGTESSITIRGVSYRAVLDALDVYFGPGPDG